MDRLISKEDDSCEPGSILEFYRDSGVFITGGTGFMGMVLLEKLLRACSVRKIFLLMRAKKGKDIEERLSIMMADPVSCRSFLITIFFLLCATMCFIVKLSSRRSYRIYYFLR